MGNGFYPTEIRCKIKLLAEIDASQAIAILLTEISKALV
jgi:hypothetical protein